MRLLLLSPFPYSRSAGQGGATACFNALEELVKGHQVAVLCFRDIINGADELSLQELRSKACLVRAVPLRINKFKVLRAKLFSILGPIPEQVYYFQSPLFIKEYGNIYDEFNPDVVICQFPQMAQYLKYIKNVPAIQDVQDAFSVSWFRRAITSKSVLNRWYAFKQWRNWVNYERCHYPLAAQCWTLSDQDKFGLTAFNPKLHAATVGLPLGHCKCSEQESLQRLTVGFIASYAHEPNVEALRYLIQSILPEVVAELPAVEFIIAGRNPPDDLRGCESKNLRFVGFVESLDSFYSQCEVIAVPLLSGGGLKIKLAEAMCYGKAVVTTSVGVDGICFSNGVNIFVADTTKLFASRICFLLSDFSARKSMELAALDSAKRNFSIDLWTKRVDELLKCIVHEPVAFYE